MKRETLLRLSVPAAAALIVATAATPAFAAAPGAPTVTEVGDSVVIGQSVKFKFSETDGSQPAEYRWTINGGELTGRVTATDGKATAKILATTSTNRLQVYAIGTDGGVGAETTVYFFGTQPSPYADQDLDGDGQPDLAVVVGDTLLEADGKGTGGKVRVPAVDLGPNGTGVGRTFAGAQVITGKFSGRPFEDYLAYFPGTDTTLEYNGLGAANKTYPDLLARDEHSLNGMFSDWDGNNPIQLATAYDSAGQGLPYADVIGVLGSASAHHLVYYISNGGLGNYQFPIDTGASTPAGGSDWENWRLSSKQLPSGTALSLWKPSTGELYLWEGVTFNSDSGRLSYTQYKLSADFRTGADDTTLRLTDFDADGVPDIWGVSADGSVTAYQVTGLSETGTAKIKAKAPQPLL